MKRFKIKYVEISVIDLRSAIIRIGNCVSDRRFGYICVTNARTTYIANKDPDYCRIQNNSLLTVPDGAPLVWIGRNKGCKGVGRVSGKDLMDELLAISKSKGYSHYFYGSTPNTVLRLSENLEDKFPGIDIKDAVSPPFQPVENFDIDKLASEINSLMPTFFWCGLGAPKQERLIAMLQPKLKGTICIGVGLAFEYIAGTVKRAPGWMRNNGMEWLYRLAQQPKKIGRAVYPLSWILLYLLLSFFRGKKCLET